MVLSSETTLSTRRHGFTLIELMIVVALIGILAAIGVSMYQEHAIRAQVVAGFAELNKVKPR